MKLYKKRRAAQKGQTVADNNKKSTGDTEVIDLTATEDTESKDTDRPFGVQELASDGGLLLIFPFEAESSKFEEAVAGLEEFAWDGPEDFPTNFGYRKVIICRENRSRLNGHQLLDGTLVEFAMMWMMRFCNKQEDEKVYAFSPLFFSKMFQRENNDVTQWTAKLGIDVFKIKIVLIPIGEEGHWSLCSIVNAGKVKCQKEDGPMACMIFLDPKRTLHYAPDMTRRLRHWLNGEWKRLGYGTDSPFLSEEAFPMFKPTAPKQKNHKDCGVYVIKFAQAMMLLRNAEFNRDDPWFTVDLVSARDEFRFDQSSIRRLREHLGMLIDRLSEIYHRTTSAPL